MEQHNSTESNLDDITEGLSIDDAQKKSIETLHPKDDERRDRLTILTDEEISAHAIVEFHLKALETKDLTKGFVVRGLSDKIKALKVSKEGKGREELGNSLKSPIMGYPQSDPGYAETPRKKGGFLRRLMGRG